MFVLITALQNMLSEITEVEAFSTYDMARHEMVRQFEECAADAGHVPSKVDEWGYVHDKETGDYVGYLFGYKAEVEDGYGWSIIEVKE